MVVHMKSHFKEAKSEEKLLAGSVLLLNTLYRCIFHFFFQRLFHIFYVITLITTLEIIQNYNLLMSVIM